MGNCAIFRDGFHWKLIFFHVLLAGLHLANVVGIGAVEVGVILIGAIVLLLAGMVSQTLSQIGGHGELGILDVLHIGNVLFHRVPAARHLDHLIELEGELPVVVAEVKDVAAIQRLLHRNLIRLCGFGPVDDALHNGHLAGVRLAGCGIVPGGHGGDDAVHIAILGRVKGYIAVVGIARLCDEVLPLGRAFLVFGQVVQLKLVMTVIAAGQHCQLRGS